MMISCTKGAAKVSFEHTENRFELPALAIAVLWKIVLLKFSIVSCDCFRFAILSCSTALCSWDGTFCIALEFLDTNLAIIMQPFLDYYKHFF
jgi:hypothetical protein